MTQTEIESRRDEAGKVFDAVAGGLRKWRDNYSRPGTPPEFSLVAQTYGMAAAWVERARDDWCPGIGVTADPPEPGC